MTAGAGCDHHHLVVRAIAEGPRARPYRQERQRRDTNQVGARATLEERRSPELAKSNHPAFEKAPLLGFPQLLVYALFSRSLVLTNTF
jgi:hypothetical protein